MRKTFVFAIMAAALEVFLAGAAILALGSAGYKGSPSAAPLSASQRFNCLGITGTVTTQGTTPDINCLTQDRSARLDITTRQTPLPVPDATRAPAAPHGTAGVRTPSDSEDSSRVQVNIQGRSNASSSDVTIDNGNSQSAEGASASNSNSSTTSVTITNR